MEIGYIYIYVYIFIYVYIYSTLDLTLVARALRNVGGVSISHF